MSSLAAQVGVFHVDSTDVTHQHSYYIQLPEPVKDFLYKCKIRQP